MNDDVVVDVENTDAAVLDGVSHNAQRLLVDAAAVAVAAVDVDVAVDASPRSGDDDEGDIDTRSRAATTGEEEAAVVAAPRVDFESAAATTSVMPSESPGFASRKDPVATNPLLCRKDEVDRDNDENEDREEEEEGVDTTQTA